MQTTAVYVKRGKKLIPRGYLIKRGPSRTVEASNFANPTVGALMAEWHRRHRQANPVRRASRTGR